MTIRLLAFLTAAGIVGSITVAGAAEDPLPKGARLVQRIEWKSVTLPQNVRMVPDPNGGNFIIITNPNDASNQITLWSTTKPDIQTRSYALRGKVRYIDVNGIAYFNLWNEFRAPEPGSPKLSYFSRTLDADGPMMKITGSSNWRSLLIPFDASANKLPLDRLELDLVFAGRGEVSLSDLDLLEFGAAAEMWASLGVKPEPPATAPAPRDSRPTRPATSFPLMAVTVFVLAALAALVWRRAKRPMKERVKD
jgi:hypothetical protein